MAAPPVPPKSPQQQQQQPPSVRQRANTFHVNASSPRLSPAVSISRAQGYRQPAGTDKAQRTWDREAASKGSSPVVARGQVEREREEAVQIGGQSKGKRRAVFCDLVVEDLGAGEEGDLQCAQVFSPFLSNLGTSIRPPSNDQASRSATPRPSTPGKPPRVDYGAVRRHLYELWDTEASYFRKIHSLLTDFATPLRTYSKKASTAVIPQFEATHLFINIEELVPIAFAFERDLRQVADYIRGTRDGLPEGFGEMILGHVERMDPYRKWLASHTQSDAIRRELEKSSSSFRQYIEATQLRARDSTQQTGGFTEFLAEPFQRVSRYRLMLDPIIARLPPDSPDVEPLQIAVGILSDICSMRVDEATRKAASLWALMEAIEGFPASMVGYDRTLIDVLDVDEILPSADSSSRPQTLRCTLILFSDKVLIAKRPSGTKTGRQLMGLDDPDHLVLLYQSSHLSSTQASLIGSPKKLKKGSMGYRGHVDLLDVSSVDVGPHDFALSLGDNPPSALPSERWNGRPARRYVVAATYAADVRRAEKEVWLNRFNEAVVCEWLKRGARGAWRSRRIWENEGVENSTEVYYCLWDRRAWEQGRGGKRGKLALQLEEGGGPDYDLDVGADGNPCVVAKAVFFGGGDDRVRFSVKSEHQSARASAETITVARITPAVAELGLGPALYSLPPNRPTTPGGSRARPLSGMLSAALDVFGGSSSSLKRGHSTTSKTSAATTSSWLSNSLSNSTASRGGGSRTPTSPFGGSSWGSRSRDESRRKLEKKSAPQLGGSLSTVGSTRRDESFGGLGGYGGEQHEEVLRGAGHARSQTALGVPASASDRSRPSDSSARHRRSSSQPAPRGHFNSYTSEAEDDQEEELSASRYASTAPQPYQPATSTSAELPSQTGLLYAAVDAVPDPDAMEDAPNDTSYASTSVSTTASPAYAAPPRRRMMGPREPGSAPPARRGREPSPVNRHQRSATGPEQAHPFARDASPTPRPFERDISPSMATTLPLRTQSQSRSFPAPAAAYTASLQPTPEPTPSPASSATAPSPASAERTILEASTTATKRPLTAAAPRATPAKKVASLAMAFENGGSPSFPRGSSPSSSSAAQPLRTSHRSVSNSSTASASWVPSASYTPGRAGGRSGRRVASNASTIRGISPPPKPKVAKEMDVFDDVPSSASRSEQYEVKEVTMEDQTSLPPLERLREHVQSMRAKLSLDVASKENDRIVSSPGRISRSPHTRNVSLKALSGASAFASSYSETRKSSSSVDLPALLRWMDALSELVATFEAEAAAKASEMASPEKGPSDVEYAMLEQERDLLAAEVTALKAELTTLVDAEISQRQTLDSVNVENGRLRVAYTDITAEVDNLFEEFNTRLTDLVNAFQSEIVGLQTSAPSLELSRQLQVAVDGRTTLERELRDYKRETKAEMERMADKMQEQERMLRAAGLIA